MAGTFWQEGFVRYDGTIIVFYACPGMDSDVYYTCKCNYGLNTQVCVRFRLYRFNISLGTGNWSTKRPERVDRHLLTDAADMLRDQLNLII